MNSNFVDPGRSRRRRFGWSRCWLVGLAACQGDGSDVGPSFGAKPPEPFQVQVFDDRSQPVCGARVTSPVGTAVSGRVGRAESIARPSGTNVLRIDASSASAGDGDLLQGLAFAATSVDDARGVERAIYLPDVATSDSLTVPAGVQTAGAVLDDIDNGGGLLVVNAGANVSDGPAPVVTLRTGKLEPRHLPQPVPTPAGFAALVSRAVLVSPKTALLGPGVVLAVPDDLATAGTATPIDLFRLDESSGAFTRVGSGVATPGRIATPLSGIDRGGLYVFAAFTPRVATVSGRVVDADGKPLARVFVHAGGRATTTAADGTFSLSPLAAFDFAGNARTEVVELVGGRGLLPATATSLATLADGAVALGDLRLDTVASAHLRVLLVERGGVLAERRVRSSEALGQTAAEGYVGADGLGLLEDLAAGSYGVTFGRPFDRLDAFRTLGLVRIQTEDRVFDARFFSQRGPYDERRRGNSVQVFDADGGGPVQDAAVVRGAEPEKGYLGRTFEGGVVFAGLGGDDQITAVSDRTRADRRVVSAFTVVATVAHRIELPVHTPPARAVGIFARHGLVAGRVSGGTAGRARELRVSLPLSYREWFERTLLDAPLGLTRTPLKAAPTQDAEVTFTVGVPRPRGHLALVETRANLGSEVVEGAFVAFDVDAPEADTTSLSGAFLRRDTDFTVLAADGGRDPRIVTWVADWGVEHAGKTIADVARGTIPVETRLIGSTLTLTLPALSGVLAGGRHLVCVRGAATLAGTTVEQRQVIPLAQPAGNPAAAMLAVPALQTPASGEVVSADGFTVTYAPPADATFVTVRLHSDTPAELREWTAVLPATMSGFTFRKLPPEAAAVLAAGRQWQLDVTAFRVTYGPIAQEADLYNSVIANLFTLGPADLGVDAISRVSISVSTP